jgi:hypothetical protein
VGTGIGAVNRPLVPIRSVFALLSQQSLALLRIVLLLLTLKDCGVFVLYEPQKYPPMNNVPWEVVLDTLHEKTARYALQEQKEEVY